MRKVLIISELFYPSSRIGAVRPTKLANYLDKRGYEVVVFTSNKNFENNALVHELPYKVYYASQSDESMGSIKESSSQRVSELNGKQSVRFIQELKMAKRQLLSYKDGKSFKNIFIKYIENRDLNLKSFDCVFSTFGPVSSLLCGLEAKKRNPDIVWINDFRDPMVSQIMPKILHPFYGWIQRKSIRIADYTTTVSKGYAKRMSFRRMKGTIEVIPNGYDLEDKPVRETVDISTDMFSFAYVGALYEGKRDLSILFKQLSRLIKEGLIKEKELIFYYAGGEGAYLKAQAEKYSLSKIICDYGTVSRHESIKIQAKSRFLVLSTWNAKGEEGVFPGKLLEYILMEKPIISTVGGTLSDCEVTQVIKSNHLGVSYECAAPETEEKMYEWLKSQAIQYNNNKPAIFNPDREKISQTYNWENIVERFCVLIDG